LYSIEKSEAKIADLKAEIKKLDAEIAELNSDISDLSKKISKLENEIEKKTKKREKEHADFVAIETDLATSIDQLGKAADIISKASKPAFLQGASKEELTKSAENAMKLIGKILDAGKVNLVTHKGLTSLLQTSDADEDEQSQHKGGSAAIVEKIEEMKEKAEEELTAARSDLRFTPLFESSISGNVRHRPSKDKARWLLLLSVMVCFFHSLTSGFAAYHALNRSSASSSEILRSSARLFASCPYTIAKLIAFARFLSTANFSLTVGSVLIPDVPASITTDFCATALAMLGNISAAISE